MKSSVLTTLATGLLLAGCVTAPAFASETSETRTLSAFNQVKASNGLDVTLVCGTTAQARIEGTAADVADTETTVSGHVLTVHRSASLFTGHHHPVRVEVTVPQSLDTLAVSSGASLKAPACALSPERLDLEASSGGTLKLAGNTNLISAEASSGATIEPQSDKRIDAAEAEIHASSGASVKLCKIGKLRAKSSSGAQINTEPGAIANDIHSSSGGAIGTRSCS